MDCVYYRNFSWVITWNFYYINGVDYDSEIAKLCAASCKIMCEYALIMYVTVFTYFMLYNRYLNVSLNYANKLNKLNFF